MSEQNFNDSNEITLKELILIVQEYFDVLWSNKKWIILCGIVIASLFFGKSHLSNLSYTATTTFMVNSDNGGGGLAGLGGLLGSIGIGKKGESNLDKILELSKTRNIASKALFQKMEINGSNDFLANHIINYKRDREEWAVAPFYKFWGSESPVKNFLYTHGDVDNFSFTENGVLKNLHGILIGGTATQGLITSSYEEESGIMSIACTSGNEELSFYIAKNLFETLSNYYVEKSVEKQLATFNIINTKVDSIKQELLSVEYSLAKMKDSNRGLYLKTDKLKAERLSAKVQILYMALGKAMENKEIAEFALKTKMPYIQVIDDPLMPLMPIVESKFRSLILGGLIGMIISSIFLLGRKIIKDSLQ